ncbi:MAG TPA: efflux RND transporter periplasmic adaptor subunit [Hyphomicrobiales bacterium]|nr:efflux RND transporter periplasmic adaptor subunit [Hyphomicrobiales bacterium]
MRNIFKPSAAPFWFSLLLLAGCGPDQATPSGQAAPPPPEVEVVALAKRQVALELQYPGRASGSREVEVRARVDGILLRRHYQEGAAVQEGALLFEIDPQPYQVALERAGAQMKQAEAQLRSTSLDWERAESVFARGAISASDHDAIRAAFELAEASTALARAERRATEINLGYTKVTAPISGITSREALSEGSLVGPTQGMSLLTRLVRTDPLYVVFAIPESEYASLRRLRTQGVEAAPLGADLLYDDGAVALTGGSIDFTASTIDAGTGTVQARAVFPNPDNAVLPGQFTRIRLTDLTLDDALLVPQAAVMQGPQGTFVLSVDAQNMVQYTPISTGLAVGSDWLVTGGVDAGLRVITSGLLKVQPGMPVTPVPPAAP